MLGCTNNPAAEFGGCENSQFQQISSYPIANRRRKSTGSSASTQTRIEPDPDPRWTILCLPRSSIQKAAIDPSAPVFANTHSRFNTSGLSWPNQYFMLTFP